MSWRVLEGDAIERLRELDAGSVQTCITSPPYWGLRDYGDEGQLGLEPTPEQYVANLVAVFREVRRVLRDDGTVWLNLGDSYASNWPCNRRNEVGAGSLPNGKREARPPRMGDGLKDKDLVGIPWSVAFALRQPYEVTAIKDRADRAWLAAMIDGEGCITTTVAQPTTGKNESYAVVVQVRMADRECLDRIVEITGMSKVQAEAHTPSMKALGQRPAFAWKIAGENAATVLAEIYPYLRIKRRQAVAAWNLQRLKDGVTTKRGVVIPEKNMAQRRELHRVIRSLNQREAVDVPGWCRVPSYTVEPGWYLRSDVVWAKPNPMPESVTDRPTRSHEYIFLLTKSARYYFDQDAVREGMSQMPRGQAADGVLSAAQSAEPRFDLQGVREGEGQGMAGERWCGERKGGGETIRADGARSPEANRVPTQPSPPTSTGGISPESRGQESQPQGEQLEGGQGTESATRADGQGSGGSSADQSQAASSPSNRSNADGRGMDGDPGSGERTMHVLRERGTADDGSHHPASEGRDAYERERDGGVQALQQPQEGSSGRNIRSVWHVATQPFPGAHFATFPPNLIEPCVLAGSPPKCCGECGAPWERLLDHQKGDEEAIGRPKHLQSSKSTLSLSGAGSREWAERGSTVRTVGWQPSCECGYPKAWPSNEPEPYQTASSVVLDPFAGAGTTGVVALRHDRDFIGIELNPDYAEMARNRIRDDQPLFNWQGEA